MADQKISALPAVVAASGTDEIHTNESGVSKKVTVAQIAAFIGSSPITIKALASNLLLGGSTVEKVTGLDQVVGVGTWIFNYYIRYRSSTATTGMKFAVNHSGTVTSFVANSRWVGVSSSDATGNATQDGGNFVVTSRAARAISTSEWGGTNNVDTTDADMLMIIEGLMVVTVSGDIQLYAGNEINSSHVTVMANSSLILTKIA